MPDPIQQIVAPFQNGGWPYVDSLPASRAIETLHLDFTTKADPSKGALDQDDRKALSIALSGFPNSEGGVLVWGVNARRGSDGFDRVQSIEPISELTRFLSELQGALPDLVSFQVPGVQMEPIRKPPDADAIGVVLTVIPQSDMTPHMATGRGLHRYYLRNGSQFLEMEHYQVADQFGRRAHPRIKLLVEWRVRVGLHSRDSFQLSFDVDLAIRNEGRGLLRYPSVTLAEKPTDWDGRHFSYLPERPTFGRRWLQFVAGADLVIHPNDQIPVVSFHKDLGNRVPQDTPDFVLEYLAVADKSPPDESIFVIHSNEIEARARRAAQEHEERRARGELR
jgi:hypothetical protein